MVPHQPPGHIRAQGLEAGPGPSPVPVNSTPNAIFKRTRWLHDYKFLTVVNIFMLVY